MVVNRLWPLWVLGLLITAVLACADPTPAPTATANVAPTPAPTAIPAPSPTAKPANTPTPAPPEPTASPTAAPAPPLPTAVLTPTPVTADAESAAGNAAVHGRWEGMNAIGPNQFGIIVTCQGLDGELSCTLDVPAQGLSGQELSNVIFEAGRFHFELDLGVSVAVWDGELRGDAIEGEFGQSGLSGTFRLERASLAQAPVPEEELPYDEEEIEFHSGDITLAGTLTLPESAGPYPAVVLISGSGGQNRDEEVAGFPVFKVIADHLTRHGIAALRYDDPGVGGSTGDVSKQTIPDRPDNVLAAVGLLLQHAEIDPDRIGLIGHSEGGIVAPLVASRSDDVSFVVLLAGTGVPGDEILRAQLEFLVKDAAAEEAETARAHQERLFRVLATGEGWDEFEEATRQLLFENIEAAPESERAVITDAEAYVDTLVTQQLKTVQSPWYKSFFEHDPGPALEQLTLPVLALFGELDSQVPAEMNAVAMAEALTEAGNADFTLFTFPGANHLFQAAVTGSISEYAELKPEFIPGFLERIEEWIATRVDKQ